MNFVWSSLAFFALAGTGVTKENSGLGLEPSSARFFCVQVSAIIILIETLHRFPSVSQQGASSMVSRKMSKLSS